MEKCHTICSEMSTQHRNTKYHRRRYYELHREEILAKARALRECPEWNKREVERKRAYYLKHKERLLKKLKKQREARSAEAIEVDKQRYRTYKRENREKVRASRDKRREYHNQKLREKYAKKKGGQVKQYRNRKGKGEKKKRGEGEEKKREEGEKKKEERETEPFAEPFTSERDVLSDLFPEVLSILEESEPEKRGTFVFQIL